MRSTVQSIYKYLIWVVALLMGVVAPLMGVVALLIGVVVLLMGVVALLMGVSLSAVMCWTVDTYLLARLAMLMNAPTLSWTCTSTGRGWLVLLLFGLHIKAFIR